MNKTFQKINALNDKLTKSSLEQQVLDKESRYFGGVIDEHTGIPSPTHVGTGRVIASWVSSYVSETSAFHHDSKVGQRIGNALDYMLNKQHGDGTISPGYTNYHSPPDTAFVVTGLSQIYRLLRANGARDLAKKAKLFLEKTIPAMLTGGIHTPNHRWVISSALANLYHIFKDERLFSRAEQWLQEGMDMTDDGEWTERSNGIYNSVSDICLYHTATLMDKPELLDSVRKNLKMMMYLVHPNGDIVTDYSGRQDLGKTYDLSPYHLVYRLMADHDNDINFYAMAEVALERISDLGSITNHIMLGYLAFPSIQKDVAVEDDVLPTCYEKVINASYPMADNLAEMARVGHHGKIEHSSMHTSFGAPFVRYRDDQTSATIMTRNDSFFALRQGKANLLGVQLFTSFSPGIVEFDQLKQVGNGYRLSVTLEKGYNGPISEAHLPKKETAWYLLPHQYRELTHNQQFRITIELSKEDENWSIRILTDEREDVFMQIVFLFHLEDQLIGAGLENLGDNAYFWRRDPLTLVSGEDCLMLESGMHEHWQENLRNTEQQDLKQVKVNMISPVDKTFRLTTEE